MEANKHSREVKIEGEERMRTTTKSASLRSKRRAKVGEQNSIEIGMADLRRICTSCQDAGKRTSRGAML